MKPIKFDLPINNTRIATLKQLQENLTPEILEHFRSGKLSKWLKVRNLNEQENQIDNLVSSDIQHEIELLKSIYALFEQEIDDGVLRRIITEYKKSLTPNTTDLEIEAIQSEYEKEIEKLKVEIEQLKNPPHSPAITRIREIALRELMIVLYLIHQQRKTLELDPVDSKPSINSSLGAIFNNLYK